MLLIQGLDLKVVDDVEDAEFILVHGTEALGLSSGSVVPKQLEELHNILEQCAPRKIPMVVANPDYVTVEARALKVMPGKLFMNVSDFNLFSVHCPQHSPVNPS